MIYLTAEQVLFLHARLVTETGGSQGLLDMNLFLSAVNRPKASFDAQDLYSGFALFLSLATQGDRGAHLLLQRSLIDEADRFEARHLCIPQIGWHHGQYPVLSGSHMTQDDCICLVQADAIPQNGGLG